MVFTHVPLWPKVSNHLGLRVGFSSPSDETFNLHYISIRYDQQAKTSILYRMDLIRYDR